MHKVLSIFLLSVFIFVDLYSSELATDKLVRIYSNEAQKFQKGRYSFLCNPYGVMTLERMYLNAPEDSVCRKAIKEFYSQRKDLEYFLHDMMFREQFYSVIYKDKKCVINIQGQRNLSEILLEKGLAIKFPNTLDREYDFYFYKTEQIAKVQRKGLWDTNIPKDCASSIYAKEKE